jgi:hypothetical protein
VLARGSINEVIAEHSVGTVELVFAGPAPDLARLALNSAVTTNGSRVRIKTNDTEFVTATILANLNTLAVNLCSLTVSQPSLESAFLQLTDSSNPSLIEEVVDVR